jgi:hypothetical protein
VAFHRLTPTPSSECLACCAVPCYMKSDLAVGIIAVLLAVRPRITFQKRHRYFRFHVRFLVFTASRLTLEPPTFRLLFEGNRNLFPRGMKLTTLLVLEPNLRMRGAIPPLPHRYVFVPLSLFTSGTVLF